MKLLTLVPIGACDPEVVDYLSLVLPDYFGCVSRVRHLALAAQDFFDPVRRQYHSTLLLAELLRLGEAGTGEVILGVTDHDLYIPILTFVFGEAVLRGRVAIVSTHRLRQERYGLPADQALLLQRVEKEALHELGHTQGLVHCRDSLCVMHFSNSVEEVDMKGGAFCEECLAALNGE
ncbi:MAG: archaemetzincin family Zn-dependent metalloprotease [Acidobacteriota bacterium]